MTTPTLPIGLDEAFDGGDVRATQVVAHSVVAFHPLQDPICSVEVSHAMGTGTKQGTASVAVCYRESGPSWWSEGLSTGPLRAEGENRPSRPSHIVPCVIDRAAYNQGENAQFDPHIEETETMDPLVARGPHAVGVPCGFYATAGAHNTGFTEDGSPTLKCESSGWGSVAATIPFAFKSSYFTRGKDGAPSEIKPPLSADADKGDQDTLLHTPESIVRRLTPMECERLQGFPDDYTKIPKVVGTLTTRTGVANDNFSVEVGHCIAQDGVPRWITPTECERLQGFPDDYSKVPVKGKYAADGPRYKALGNSMAVPVMRWIGRRIAKVDALLKA